ncbi:sugar transporter [Pseudooceanicola sp.]|uniref:sugar transporter n=1 Tax=Pseudooceanicola sp. TaxID=1914328 RepID=UPI0035C67585
MTLVFLCLVPLPVGGATWYLLVRAQPQFASTFGFVIHSESEGASSVLLSALPAIGGLGGSSSKDTDVLARYLHSQALVEKVGRRLDLRALWSAPHERDPIFTFDPKGTIEDLTRFWQRMVRVHYDHSAGVMEVEVRSFEAQTAQAIAQEIEAASSTLINRLSGIAREDRLRHAREELQRAERRLTDARQALTSFRAKHQVIDPMTDLAGGMQVIADLQQQLTEELVATEELRQTLAAGTTGARRENSGDFRIRMSERRIAILHDRIAEERAKIGGGGEGSYARMMGDFERLSVGVEIAQQAYVAALAAWEAARAEADRQSRYVATYAAAQRPERALYPRTWQMLALVAAGAILCWSVVMLVIYGLRDRT